jgi:type I restriction enzyme S subunit
MAYTRQDMDGLIGSDDIIRIVPDADQIPSGYLYAFLSGAVGNSLISQHTYGAVIQHIEAHHIADLPIPRLDPATEQRIHEMIERAAALRVAANERERNAFQLLSYELGVDIQRFSIPKNFLTLASTLHGRFEAAYHAARQATKKHFNFKNRTLEPVEKLISDMFYLGKLHRVFVADKLHGLPLVSIADAINAKISPNKFISNTHSRNVEKAKLQQGWILVSRIGTPGLVVYVRREMKNMVGTDNIVRLVPDNDKVLSGYLYVVLKSSFGQALLKGSAHGAVQYALPPEYIAKVEVPLIRKEAQKSIHDLIEDYGEDLTRASELEDEAQALLLAALGWHDD